MKTFATIISLLACAAAAVAHDDDQERFGPSGNSAPPGPSTPSSGIAVTGGAQTFNPVNTINIK